MSRDPAPAGRQKRDQQTNFVMTKEEKADLLAFAERRMMSVSNAVRYLVMKGLATEEEGD